MRKKLQIEGVVYAIIVIFVVGFLLAWFSPLIKEVTEDTYDNHVSEDKVFSRLILLALSPAAWIFYVILSLLILYFAMNGGGT